MPDILDSLCAYCNLLPQMNALAPGHYCAICLYSFRRKALSDRFQGIMADRGRRDPEWAIPAHHWGQDAQWGGGA